MAKGVAAKGVVKRTKKGTGGRVGRYIIKYFKYYHQLQHYPLEAVGMGITVMKVVFACVCQPCEKGSASNTTHMLQFAVQYQRQRDHWCNSRHLSSVYNCLGLDVYKII